MDNKTFPVYLNLTAVALYGRAIGKVSPDDWLAASGWARQQRTEGLLYEAALLASPPDRPPRKLLLELYAYSLRLEQTNEMMSERIAELFDTYVHLGATPILLKGHSVALNYPHPEWRTPGDIDVFLPEGFAATDVWARANGTAVTGYDPQTNKHVEFQWKGFCVENHFLLSIFYNRSLNRKLQAAFAEGMKAEPNSRACFAGRHVDLLPPTVGLLHLWVHFANHIVSEGIGLRQLCDIFMYLHKRHAEIDARLFNRWVDDLRLTRLTDAITTVAVTYFHAPEEDFPYRWSADPRRAKVLLQLVQASGNYGNGFSPHAIERRFHRLYKLRLLIQRSAKVNLLLPDELRAAWWGKTRNMMIFALRALRKNTRRRTN